MKTLILTVVCVALGMPVYAQTAQPAKCTKANGQIAVTNPFPNWKYDSGSSKPEGNSCTLEKKDSVPNPVYVNTQIQVMFNDKKFVSVPLETWFADKQADVKHIDGVSDIKVSDAVLAGKKAKKIAYTRKWQDYDKIKSVNVFHEDYYVVQPGYALEIMTYVPEPDSPKARPEMEKIVRSIELK